MAHSIETIREGEEYQIVRYPDKKVLYEGIAESDNEATERLETYVLYMRANLNVTHTITLKLKKL